MAVSRTYTAETFEGSRSSGIVTMDAISIGAADAGRLVVMAYTYEAPEDGTAASNTATIGGVSATRHVRASTTVSALGIIIYDELWSAVVPTGTTAVFEASHLDSGEGVESFHVAAWRVLGQDTTTPVSATGSNSADANSVSCTLTVAADGALIANAYSIDTSFGWTWSGGGVTEDYDSNDGSLRLVSGASGTTSGSQTPQASHTGSVLNLKIIAAVSIQPVVAAVTGTGTLVADAATLAASGVSASLGTGTISVSAATLAASGVSASLGTGTISVSAATLVATGTSTESGTGTLLAQAAAVAATGVSGSTGTGALVADAAVVAGAGSSTESGTGTLVAGSATLVGTGEGFITGTGVLEAQAAVLAASGVSASTGTGTLAADVAVLAASGVSGSTGTGALAAQAATLAASGTAEWIATGALVAQASTLAATGTSGSAGTGVLAADAASVVGDGAVAFVATGTLAADAATLAGAGVSESTGTGTLVAGSASVEGYQTVSLSITADDDIGAWTDQDDGVVNIFQSIDEPEPPNDTDFVKSSNDPAADVYRFKLATPSDQVYPLIIDYKHWKVGAAGLQFTLRLMQGATMIAQATGLQSTTPTVDRLMLTQTEFNSITDFTDLFIELEADAA